jgi:predicted ATP-grasp superfamily ATP-dependent carboligase
LLRALSWHGVAEVDFRWSGREVDPAYLIEVNPRFFGGLFQALASGVDFPWLLFQLAATGHTRPPSEIAIGVRTQTPITGTLGILRELLNRPGGSLAERAHHARAVLRDNAQNRSMLLDRRDPLPALGLLYPLTALLSKGTISARVLTGARG